MSAGFITKIQNDMTPEQRAKYHNTNDLSILPLIGVTLMSFFLGAF